MFSTITCHANNFSILNLVGADLCLLPQSSVNQLSLSEVTSPETPRISWSYTSQQFHMYLHSELHSQPCEVPSDWPQNILPRVPIPNDKHLMVVHKNELQALCNPLDVLCGHFLVAF